MFWQRVISGGASSIKSSFISAESKRWYQTIQVIPRENKGHRLAIKERSQGRIPSVVLTSDYAVLPASSSSMRKQLLTTDSKQIQSLVKNDPYVFSTVYNLEILAGNGSSVVLHSGPVLPIKVTLTTSSTFESFKDFASKKDTLKVISKTNLKVNYQLQLVRRWQNLLGMF